MKAILVILIFIGDIHIIEVETDWATCAKLRADWVAASPEYRKNAGYSFWCEKERGRAASPATYKVRP